MDFSHIEPVSRAPYPYTELQEKCLRDLETTEAMQAAGRLHRIYADGSEGFCCLGRFCVVAGIPSKVELGAGVVAYGNEGCGFATLPSELAKELKLKPLGEFKRYNREMSDYNSLASMNDSGQYSFKNIAAYIRHDPWNVFTDSPQASEASA